MVWRRTGVILALSGGECADFQVIGIDGSPSLYCSVVHELDADILNTKCLRVKYVCMCNMNCKLTWIVEPASITEYMYCGYMYVSTVHVISYLQL